MTKPIRGLFGDDPRDPTQARAPTRPRKAVKQKIDSKTINAWLFVLVEAEAEPLIIARESRKLIRICHNGWKRAGRTIGPIVCVPISYPSQKPISPSPAPARKR